MESKDWMKDISKFELRDIIDAMSHQVVHLEKSQHELVAAIQEDPGDVDFTAAYNENIITLNRKKKTINELKTYLKEIDFAYYLDHYRNAPVIEDTLAAEHATDPIISTILDSLDSGGVYL